MTQTAKRRKHKRTSRHFNNISLNNSKFLQHFGNVLSALRKNTQVAKLQKKTKPQDITALRKPLSPYIMEIRKNPHHNCSRKAMELLGYLSSNLVAVTEEENKLVKKAAQTIYRDFHNPQADFPHQGRLKFPTQ